MVSLQPLLLVAALSAAPEVEVLQFTASWCAACRTMQPVIQQLGSAGYSVRMVDYDRNPDLVRRHQIGSIPATVILVGGRPVDRIVGPTTTSALVQRLQSWQRAASSPRRPQQANSSTTLAHSRSSGANAAEWERRALQATVRLRVEDAQGNSYGTGTIVDVHQRQGASHVDALILTCGHIFRESQGRGKIDVDLFAGGPATVPGELIAYDLDRDLALVGIATTARLTPMRVAGAAQRVARAQPVFSVGCNRGAAPSVMRGDIRAINKYLGPDNLVVSGEPVDGRSGGGLFSGEGYLIGVCNAADPQSQEGLYAAFPSVHQHLDKAGLAFVYRQKQEGVQLASSVAPAPKPGRQPVAAAAGQPSSAGPRLAPTSSASAQPAAVDPSAQTEVICIIRSGSGGSGQGQVVFLDRPSRQFLKAISSEEKAQDRRQMTQMRIGRFSSADVRRR